MSRNGWIIFIAICALILGGLVWMSGSNRVDVSEVKHDSVLPANDQNGNIADHVKGDPDAVVQVIEYGDFQCPGCQDAHPVMNKVVEKYEDKIAFVFRNFPLSTIHPNARAASAAAEAAGIQGKYWQMHDLLFINQSSWGGLSGTLRTDMFASYADNLELDREKFLDDLSSDAISKKINFDAALGRDAGVTGTPSIFVNGKEVTSYYKDGELVSRNDDGARPVWSDAEAFESLVLLPALRDAGVEVEVKE